MTDSLFSFTDAAYQPLGLISHNIRRLLTKHGMSYEELVEVSGLDARTIRGIVHANKQPHTKTLQKIAEAFGVSTEELFLAPQGMKPEAFDAATNPVVAELAASNPHLFQDWSSSDFVELRSRFGVGGALTAAGVLKEVDTLNDKRKLLERARVVLESTDAPVLKSLIDVLYDRITRVR